jgi:carbonic anhydrase
MTTAFTPKLFNYSLNMGEEDVVSDQLRQRYEQMFTDNRAWATTQIAKNPEFFTNLAQGQCPSYLWIGCSDSRIPAEQITGLQPGEAFVHRNIANLVCNIDLSIMSVIDYAVRHLKVKNIIVCGHYGCGGIKAALSMQDLGILNPWIGNIKDVYRTHKVKLDSIHDESDRYDRLVELNVLEQCRTLMRTAAVQQQYAENGFPVVSGLVFGLRDGLLKDLKINFKAMMKDSQKIYGFNM